MNKHAQASLEYLIIYGWVLAIVTIIVSTMVLLFGATAEPVSFNVSDPAKFTIKGTSIFSGSVQIKLQNITGGKILITSLESSGYENCSLDQQIPSEDGISIGQGSEFLILCSVSEGGQKTVTFNYLDAFGLEHTLTIRTSPGLVVTEPVGETICNDGLDNDGDSLIDCADTADCLDGTSCGAGSLACYAGVCSQVHILTPPSGGPGVISESGIYLLTQDISNIHEGYQITANNVTLDCLGHSLAGKGHNSGIKLATVYSNVKVKNCNIHSFVNGIYLSYSSDVELIGNNTYNNSDNGIWFYRSAHNTVTNNHANANGNGMVFFQASNNVLTGNEINNNALNGVVSEYSDPIMVNNTVCGNAEKDIICAGSGFGSGNSATNVLGCSAEIWSDNCP